MLKKALIVDDDENWRILYKHLFSELKDFAVASTAENAEDAIKMVAELHPDLVVTDASLPGMDGLELTEKLRKDYPALKILIITSHDRNNFYSRAIKAGANEMVEKGSTGEMLEKIKQALEK
jgi:DNA-binding NarL/FixJ family response regulator